MSLLLEELRRRESRAQHHRGSRCRRGRGDDAIHVYGRAKDKEVVKQHIVAKEKALGLTDLVPTDWPGSTKKS